LNDRGRQGWELVQISFSKDGAMAFWKRAILETEMEAGSRGSALEDIKRRTAQIEKED
jgi:hypothetical protein